MTTAGDPRERDLDRRSRTTPLLTSGEGNVFRGQRFDGLLLASGAAKLNGGSNMAYVDGFVVPVPKDNIEKYRKVASDAGAVWREYGALAYHECVADDVKPGEVTSFPQSVKLEPHETVVFAWIVYRDRQHRDEVNAKVMKDPRITGAGPEAMPFDGKRMIYGGFKTLVEL